MSDCACEIVDGKVVNACGAHCEWAEAMINKPNEETTIEEAMFDLGKYIRTAGGEKGIAAALFAVALAMVDVGKRIEERLKDGITVF